MSEVNARWERDTRYARRMTAAGAATAVALWTASYLTGGIASWATEASFLQGWLGFASLVTFIGAVGTTVGSGFGVAWLLTNDKPLPGSNY